MFNSSTAINTVMGLMSHLTASDLKEILNDDNKFEQYANELKMVSNYVTIVYNTLTFDGYYLIVEQRNRYWKGNVNSK